MAYSIDLRERVVKAVQAGGKHKDVAKQFAIGVATLRRYVQREKRGKLAPDSPPGRPADIPAEQYGLLSKQGRKTPDATLEEHCDMWVETQGKEVSITVMCRSLQRARLTRKKRL